VTRAIWAIRVANVLAPIIGVKRARDIAAWAIERIWVETKVANQPWQRIDAKFTVGEVHK
jgi:hypothetical protein